MPALCTHLLAIIPPGSVEARLGKVQAGIFEEHGMVSSIALPPLIPVAFLAESPADPAVLRGVERSVAAPWRMETRGATWEAGCLFFVVSSSGLWASLHAAALGRAAAATGPFPAFEGFFAGCLEANREQRSLIRPAVPALAFTSARLAVVTITSPRGPEGWWNEVTWEIRSEVPLRGRRGR
jgi:hypothetical protein